MDAYDNDTSWREAHARHHGVSLDKMLMLAITIAIMIAVANGII